MTTRRADRSHAVPAVLPPLRSTAIEAGLAALVSAALALLVMAPVLSSLNSAWFTADMLSQYVTSQTWSWWSFAPTDHYGFPMGLDYNYWPNGDLVENVFTHAVSALSGSPFTGVNLLILVSFPVAAALAAVLLRLVRMGGPLAVVLAVVISMLPYHWARALIHTYLSTTVSMLTGLILVILIASGRIPVLLGGPTQGRRLAGWCALLALLMATAWMGVYYAVFSVLLGIAALAWRFLKGDHWTRMVRDAAVVLSLVLLAMVPQALLVVSRTQGPLSEGVAERGVFHSYYLAGSLFNALLPWPQSVFTGYNDWVAAWLKGAPPYESIGAGSFGTLVTSGCLAVFLLGLARRARRGRPVSPPDASGTTPGLIGWLIAATLAFFIPWGLNIAFAISVSPAIRSWNRLLPALLTLFVLGAATIIRNRLSSGRAALWIAVTALLVMALDVVVPASASFATSAKEHIAITDRARAYGEAVNAAIPGRCAVLQLPVREFPEPAQQDNRDRGYGHLWISLTNPEKDFTYGAMRGTQAQKAVAALAWDTPTYGQLDRLAAEGICAIHVDRAAYEPATAESLVGTLTTRFGAPVAEDAEESWSTWRVTSESP